MSLAHRKLMGRVIAVRGTVVDAQFDDALPPLDTVLECGWEHDGSIMAVVQSHVGDATVRVIATDSTRELCRGATHCCSSSGRAGVAISCTNTRAHRAPTKRPKCHASPCRKSKGALHTSDTRSNRTGRHLANQSPAGSAMRATMSQETPWNSPAYTEESCKSSRMNGKNIPRVNDVKATLLVWRRDKSATTQPRAGVEVQPAVRNMERITTLERPQRSAREDYEGRCHTPCWHSHGLPDQVMRTER